MKTLASILSVFLLIADTTMASAADITWTNTSGGNWNSTANWSPNSVPGSSDNAFITNNGTYTVTLDVDATVNRIILGGTSGTQTFGVFNRTFTVNGSGLVQSHGVLSSVDSTIAGTGSLTNKGTCNFGNGGVTFNAALINQGTLVAVRGNVIAGAFENQAGATFRVNATCCGAPPTIVSSGFTNLGVIELTSTENGLGATLIVSSGTLVNAPGGQINALAASGGARALTAQLNNQGTVSIGATLFLNMGSAQHTNSGTINLTGGDLMLSQSSFTTTGTITIDTGRTLNVSLGTFNYSGGSISGAGKWSMGGATANLTPNISNATLELDFVDTTVNGPGTLTCVAGKTLTFSNGGVTVNTALTNQGTLVAIRGNVIAGAFENQAGATFRVNATCCGAPATFVSSGFTNLGVIELTSTANGLDATLYVSSGTLVNAPGGQINALAASGGVRSLFAQLNNQGAISIDATLLLDGPSAHHTNSGTINLTGGNLALSLSGSAPSFTTTGTITIDAGRTLSVGGGTFNYSGGSISGAGKWSMGGATVNLTPNLSNATLELDFVDTTVNGPGTLTCVAGKTLTFGNGGVTVNTALTNQGTLVAIRGNTIAGAFENQAGATFRVNATCCGAPPTIVSGGFTNLGVIELTSTENGLGATLIVSSGTLVNAPGGQINALAASGGARALTAQLNNQGTVSIGATLFLNMGSAQHTNSGTINLTGGDLFLTGSPTFTTTGTMTIDAGRTLSVGPGGTFNYSGGSISGAGKWSMGGATANLTPNISNATLELDFVDTTVNGPGTLTCVAGETLTFSNGGVTVNTALTNQGTLVAIRGNVITGPFENQAGATFRVNATCCGAPPTIVSGGFTNLGVIELTSTANGLTPTLVVSSGTLVNAPGGQINMLTGTGGERALAAQLNNQGTLTAGTSTTLGTPSASHLNSGTVQVNSGTLTLSGTYTQTGGLTLLNGGNVANSAVLAIAGGTLAGTGTISGSVSNNAATAPGASPGLLTITGDFTQTANSTINIELAGTIPGTSFDRLAVSGTATIAGTLNVTLTNGFYPATNAMFTYLTAASVSGTFATFNYPFNDVGMQVSYTTTNSTIQVINVRPVIPVISGQTVDELVLYSLAVNATDDDFPPQTLTYALINSPADATINSSGQVTWTPSEAEGPVTTSFTVRVTDNGTPNLTVSRSFAVVVNEINVAPLLTLPSNPSVNEQTTFNANATATDPDVPTNALTFALVSGPPGLTVSTSGAIQWLPGEADGSNSYTVKIRVTDTNQFAVNEKVLSTTNMFTVTVNEVNLPPSLTVPANQTLTEETPLAVSASATDPDLPSNGKMFSLVAPPMGMMIDAGSGAISWIPDETQGSNTYTIKVVVTDDSPFAVNEKQISITNEFTVTVNESNRPPVLTVPDNQTLDEQTPLSAMATATDPDLPANALTFELVSGPSGLTVSPTGAIDWLPDEGQGPNNYTVKVKVTDNNPLAANEKMLSVTNVFMVTVNESNRPPVVGMLANHTVNAGQTVNFTATATDPDLPANALMFSLISPPSGASIGSGSGLFQWRLPMALADTTNTIQVLVIDDGAPNKSHTNSFTVIVNPLAPVMLTPVSYSGGQFTFSVSGTTGPDYIIMTSTNLVDWTDLETNAAPATPFNFMDVDAGLFGGRFYQVRLSP